MANKLAKDLEKLFFGSVGGTRTIMNGVSLGPNDTEVIRKISKAARQPLRYICNMNFTNPIEQISVDINDLSTSPIAWSRNGEGQYAGLLLGAFTGKVVAYEYPNLAGTLRIQKNSNSSIGVFTTDYGSTLQDGLFMNYKLIIEVIQLIT